MTQNRIDFHAQGIPGDVIIIQPDNSPLVVFGTTNEYSFKTLEWLLSRRIGPNFTLMVPPKNTMNALTKYRVMFCLKKLMRDVFNEQSLAV